MARNRAWPGGFEELALPPDTRRITSLHLRGYQLGGDDPVDVGGDGDRLGDRAGAA